MSRRHHELVPASNEDRFWLEQLRRDVYQDLFKATFGGWDEARHTRQFEACWDRGHISIIKINDARVGMIQLFEEPDAVEVGEIQIAPALQSQGIGSRVLKELIARVHMQKKKVVLSVALKNDRALQLYQRLGFRIVSQTETHNNLALL